VDFDFKNNQLNHGRTFTITNFAQSENNQERKNCSNPSAIGNICLQQDQCIFRKEKENMNENP
jgi:hypothetical protein